MGSFCTTCSVSHSPGPTPLHSCFLNNCFRDFKAKCAFLGLTSSFLHHHSPGGREPPHGSLDCRAAVVETPPTP